MKNILYKILINGLLLCFCIIFLFLILKGKDFGSFDNIIISIISSVVTAFFLGIIDNICLMITNKKYNFRHKYDLSYRNKEIRISFAYLIKILINDKYLLVKKEKFNKFQPIGGVYHQYDSDTMNDLGFSRDITPGDAQDIRGSIKCKNLIKFLKWFDSEGAKRERGVNREFYEELKDCIPIKEFLDLDFIFIKRKYKGIEYSVHFKKEELLVFDIFSVDLNDSQKKQLEKCIKEHKGKFYLAEKEEIKTLGVNNEDLRERFGSQTPFILDQYEYNKK